MLCICISKLSESNIVKENHRFSTKSILCNDRKVLIRHQLHSVPQSISLHPMGISVALSFEKEVKIFKLLHDTLIEEKSLEKKMEMSQVFFFLQHFKFVHIM